MTTAASSWSGRYGSGRIIRCTTGTLRSDIWPLLAVYVVLGLAPAFAFNLSDSPDAPWIAPYLVTAVGAVMELLLFPFIVAIALRPAGQRRVSAVLHVLPRIPALIVMSLVASLCILLGSLLFVVPGVILSVIWSLAAPALIAEKLGPLRALSRSRRLTKGCRWAILITLVLFWVLFLGAAFAVWCGAQTLPHASGVALQECLELALNFSVVVIFPVLTAAIYADRRLAEQNGALAILD